MTKQLYNIFFLSCVFIFQTKAQKLLTLKDAINIGLENNYSILTYKNDYEISRLNNSVGSAGMLPNIVAGINQDNQTLNTRQRFLNGAENIRNNAINNSLNSNVELNWTVFNGTRMFITRKKLAEVEMIGKLQLKQQVELTISKITKAYFEILLQQNKIEVLEQINKYNIERLDVINEKYKNGKVVKTELLKAQVDKNTDDAMLLKEKNYLLTLKYKLNELLAQNIETDFEVEKNISLNNIELYEFEALVEKNYTGLQIQKRNKDLTNYALKENKADRFPMLQFRTGYLFNTLNSEAGFLQTASTNGFHIGVGISYNLFNGFDVSRRINISRLQQNNAELTYKDSVQQIKALIKTLINTYNTALILVEREKNNVAIAKENYSLSNDLYNEGKITAIELRLAQNEMLQAENRLLTALFEAKITETELLRLSGKF
ncbi:MAG: TolC family protein [Bacteroidia bacterium]